MNLKTAPATIALGIAGLLLMVAAAWFVLIGPVVGDIGAAGATQVDAQDSNDTLRLQLVSLRRQSENLPQTDRALDKVERVWPPTADQPEFFAEVSEAAETAGISPDDITTLSPGVPTIVQRDAEGNVLPAGTPVEPPVADVPTDIRSVAVQTISITVEGTYDELSQLLENLETMPRALLTSAVEVTAAEATTGEAEFSVTVTGHTFVAPPITRASTEES